MRVPLPFPVGDGERRAARNAGYKAVSRHGACFVSATWRVHVSLLSVIYWPEGARAATVALSFVLWSVDARDKVVSKRVPDSR